MSKGLFFSLFILALISRVSGQTDYRPGIVILMNSDTLEGEIDYRGDLVMSSECRFKSQTGEKSVFKPGEINSYRFDENGKYYISKVFEGDTFFMEYLINGEMDVFFLRNEGADRYFVEKDSFPLKELPYEKGVREKNGRSYSYKSTIHKGILKIYTQDAPQLTKKLEQLGEPDHSNMVKLAKEYHNIVCKDDECIIYEKRKARFQFALELQTTYFNFSAGPGFQTELKLDYTSSLQQGLILHLWMPRTSEKLFLRTGLIMMEYGNQEDVKFAYKLPLMLEYLYPKYRVRPRVAAGLNFYNPFTQTVSFLAGMNILVTERFHLTAHYEIEALPPEQFPLIPRYNFGSSFGGGVFYRFW
jgi:hypothetical protein